ncbi:LOW QUALITY PROTEIN: hypothetical protein U9M48_003470, partial [Paspalum notatum var. saurae]
MPPPTSASDSASKSKVAKRYFFLEPLPRPVKLSPFAPTPTLGIKRPRPASASPGGQHDLGVCVSATDASATPTHGSKPSLPATNSEVVLMLGAMEHKFRLNVAVDSKVQILRILFLLRVKSLCKGKMRILNVLERGRRSAHADVWQYFTKKNVIIEDKGKTYSQGRAESNYGTMGFWTHLRTTHSTVKGQQQLKKDHGTDITAVEPYRYDEQASLKKFYLAIVMHEYPFNISDHEYFVQFIKSLRPSFPIKSRVTVRNEIMSMYLEEMDKQYNYFKNVDCCFSTTMDMWTSNQNKSYMCVTTHWVDDNWCIQKRILNFFHVKGRHTSAKLAETFTEVMVNWYVEKRLFALTLDNASANEVAVRDIITDLNVNGNASL